MKLGGEGFSGGPKVTAVLSTGEKEITSSLQKMKTMEENLAGSPPPSDEKPTSKSPPSVRPVGAGDDDVLKITSENRSEKPNRHRAWEVVPRQRRWSER